MKITKQILIALCSLTSFAIATYPGMGTLADGAPNAVSPATVKATQQLVGTAIKLREINNLGYTVELLPPLRNRNYRQFLLSVDGVNLRGQTLEQIKSRLKGAPGSTVHVEILFPNGETEIVDVVRANQPDQTEQALSPTALYRALHALGSARNHPNLLENDATNVDLVAKAYCTDSVRKCKDAPSGTNNDCSSTLIESTLLSQSIGDFDAADRYLSECLAQLKGFGKVAIRSLRIPLTSTVKNLAALGKEKEAVLLCEMLIDSSDQRGPLPLDSLRVFEAYSLIPGMEAQRSRTLLAEKLYPIYVADSTPFTQNYLWFANYLDTLGWKDKALAMYAAQEKRLQKLPQESHSFEACQPLAYCLYGKARLEAAIGNEPQAAADLEAISSLLKEKLSPEQLAVVDRLPLFFPTLKDVATAQATCNKSLPIALAPPATAMPIERPGDFDAAGHPISTELQFPIAQKCFAAVKQNNRKAAEDLANQLLSSYTVQTPMERFAAVRQNLFCTIVRVARAFADRQWYDSSDKLLSQLSTAMRSKNPNDDFADVADSIIAAEHLYNAAMSGKNMDNSWDSFQNEFHLNDAKHTPRQQPRRDYEWHERLRLLAMGYFYADELPRAKLFITQALRTDVSTNPEVAEYLQTKASERFLVLLDAACIMAKSSEFSSADQFLKQALSETYYTTDSDTTSAVLEAANVYAEKGQTAKAISFLKQVKSSKGVTARPEDETRIDSRLAELLNSHGENVESVQVIKRAIDQSPKSMSIDPSNYLLAAKSLEAVQNFSEAAKYYELAAKGRPYFGVGQMQAQDCLRKAIECATKAKGFDDKDLASLYLKLSDLTEHPNLSEALVLREKALTLLKDNDPRKPEVLSVNAYIRKVLSESASKSETSNGAPNAAASIAPSADQLAAATEAARLAAKNKLPDASEYWIRLAIAEAQANKIDLAVLHARRAIAAYSLEDPKARKPGQILESYLPSLVRKAGAPDKAELLFQDAVKRVSDVNGAGSMAAQAQSAHFFENYVAEKEYAKAENVLDGILQTNLGQGRYSVPNHDVTGCRFGPIPLESSLEVIQMIENAAAHTVTSTDNRFALTVFEKLLAAERRQFGDDDRRVALTLVCVARAHSAAGEYAKADEVYRTALPILKKYEAMMWILSSINPDYFKVLRQVNKQSEIDKIEGRRN